MMTGASTKTSTATKSADGGAGSLFSCYDFYSHFEGLSKVHARMVGAGATLNKAVRNALRETELHVCTFIAPGSIGALSSAITTIGFC